MSKIPQDERRIYNEIYTKTMEGFLRVSLAGFGGALVGLSLSRRGIVPLEGQRMVQRGRPYANQNLPAQWALACLMFSGFFEVSRALSPAEFLLGNKYLQIICDYSIAGAFAGTILRGLPVLGSQRSNSPVLPPRLGAGFVAGLVLGMIPGLLIAGTTMLEDQLQNVQAEKSQSPAENDPEQGEK